MMTPRIKRALYLSATVLVALALLHSRLSLERSWRADFVRHTDDLVLPDSEWVRALSLNHTTLAADLMWVSLVANHALTLSERGRADANLLKNGTTLTELDPGLRRAYDWVPGAFLNRRFPITGEDLDRVSDFYDIGVAHYPSDIDLRVSASLSFIGYGTNIPAEVKARQAARAAGYLERAVELAPEDSQVTSLLAYFRSRAAELKGETPDPQDEVDVWLVVLKNSGDPATRERAIRNLKALGASKLVVDDQRELSERYQMESPYLPFPLWQMLREVP